MLRLTPLVLLLLGCTSTQEQPRPDEPREARSTPAGRGTARDDRGETEEGPDRRPIPRPTAEELRDFPAVWDLYRASDPRWPLERDRYRRRSEAAGFVLAAHLMRHYMKVNALRDGAARDLARVKSEIVDVGEPCVPALVDLMVMEEIPLGDGTRFLVDDITRQDCREMLARIGVPAVPTLLGVLGRSGVGEKGRRNIALVLGGTRDGRALDPLARLLRTDPSWQVRADAATALGALGDRRALPALQECAQRDADRTVVARAGKARQRILQGAGAE